MLESWLGPRAVAQSIDFRVALVPGCATDSVWSQQLLNLSLTSIPSIGK